MNPLTNVKNITKLNEIELTKGTKKSWHDIYKESAWIFIGGLAYGLTEGDILAVFSQYGEIVNINLIRDKKTGKTKGYCFLCYANQKSTILAVDNFNGIKLCNRTIRVDHVANYKPPKEDERDDEITKKLKVEGCAPKISSLDKGSSNDLQTKKEKKKAKKEKRKKEKKKKKHPSDENSVEQISVSPKIKQERHDPGYDKYESSANSRSLDMNSPPGRSHVICKSEPSTSGDGSRSKDDHQSHREKQLPIKGKDRDAVRFDEGKKARRSDSHDPEKHYDLDEVRSKRHSGRHDPEQHNDLEVRSKRHSGRHDLEKHNDFEVRSKRHSDRHDPEKYDDLDEVRSKRHSDRHDPEKYDDLDEGRSKRHSDRHDSKKQRQHYQREDRHTGSPDPERHVDHYKKRNQRLSDKHRSRSVSADSSTSSSSTSSDEHQTKEKQSKKLSRSRKRKYSSSESSFGDERTRERYIKSSSCKKDRHFNRRQSSERSKYEH